MYDNDSINVLSVHFLFPTGTNQSILSEILPDFLLIILLDSH